MRGEGEDYFGMETGWLIEARGESKRVGPGQRMVRLNSFWIVADW